VDDHEGTKATKDTKDTKERVSDLELSHEVIGAAIEVHRVLGPGLLESVYSVALCRELWVRGISTERQVPIPVRYKGADLGCQLRLDLLVERKVIVEAKTVAKLISSHRTQLLTYLRLTNLWLGLLINFNVDVLRDGIRRVLNG
jgi:GxxExxY protein